jgi:hypothetical protein
MVVGVMDLVPYRLLDPQTLGQAGPERPPIFYFYCGRVLVMLRLNRNSGRANELDRGGKWFPQSLQSPPAVPGVDFDPTPGPPGGTTRTMTERGDASLPGASATSGGFGSVHARHGLGATGRRLPAPEAVLTLLPRSGRGRLSGGSAGWPGGQAHPHPAPSDAGIRPGPIDWQRPSPQPAPLGGLDEPACATATRNSTVRRTGPSKVRA